MKSKRRRRNRHRKHQLKLNSIANIIRGVLLEGLGAAVLVFLFLSTRVSPEQLEQFSLNGQSHQSTQNAEQDDRPLVKSMEQSGNSSYKATVSKRNFASLIPATAWGTLENSHPTQSVSTSAQTAESSWRTFPSNNNRLVPRVSFER